jgi:hypothetical protein
MELCIKTQASRCNSGREIDDRRTDKNLLQQNHGIAIVWPEYNLESCHFHHHVCFGVPQKVQISKFDSENSENSLKKMNTRKNCEEVHAKKPQLE